MPKFILIVMTMYLRNELPLPYCGTHNRSCSQTRTLCRNIACHQKWLKLFCSGAGGHTVLILLTIDFNPCNCICYVGNRKSTLIDIKAEKCCSHSQSMFLGSSVDLDRTVWGQVEEHHLYFEVTKYKALVALDVICRRAKSTWKTYKAHV